MLRNALFLLVSITVTAAAGAATGHNHAAAPDPCADREAPASLRCALAPTGALDREGRLWVAWSSGGHVYVNHTADQGRSFSAPMPVNRIPERIAVDGENRPKLAFGPRGELYVSWTLRLDKPYSGHVRFARSADGGRTFAEPVTINDHQEVTSHRFDSLAVNERGEIFLAWLDKRDRLAADKRKEPYAGAALYYTVSTDGGESFAPNQNVLDHSCECCRTAMALDGRGLPVIAWRHIYGDNIRDHALVRFVDRQTPAVPIRLSHDEWRVEACPHHGPALAVGAGDRIHGAWFDNAEKRHGLFYARSAPDGTWSEPMTFGNDDHGASHPALAAVGTNVYLAWKEFDGEATRLWLMRSADEGATWGAAEALASTVGRSDHPQLTADRRSGYLTWQTNNEGFRLWPLAVAP